MTIRKSRKQCFVNPQCLKLTHALVWTWWIFYPSISMTNTTVFMVTYCSMPTMTLHMSDLGIAPTIRIHSKSLHTNFVCVDLHPEIVLVWSICWWQAYCHRWNRHKSLGESDTTFSFLHGAVPVSNVYSGTSSGIDLQRQRKLFRAISILCLKHATVTAHLALSTSCFSLFLTLWPTIRIKTCPRLLISTHRIWQIQYWFEIQ